MLPKHQRLNFKKDFKWAISGRKLETKYLKLFVKVGDPSTRYARSGPKIGIATSSQVFKKATQRNRAKRLVSAVFESLYAKLPSDVNIVALPKKDILEVKSQDVLLDVEAVLKNEKIIY